MATEEFIKARNEKEKEDAIRLIKHQKILPLLYSDSGTELLNNAFKRIETWQKNQTCSSYYIEEWYKVLNDLSLYKEIILNPKNHHLRQNTPFRMSDF